MEVSTVKTQVQNKENKPSIGRKTGAVAAGAAIGCGSIGYMAKETFGKMPDAKVKKAGETMKLLTPDVDSFENIKKYAAGVLENTGLAKKGVKIEYVNAETLSAVKEELMNATKNQPGGKNMVSNFVKMFEHGANAAFTPGKLNKVFISEKGLFSSVFHELGHAHNYNSSTVMKFIQKARILTPGGVPLAGAALFAASLFHTKKSDKDESGKKIEKSGWEKTKDFVKNHAGKITFATMMPMLFEEAVASKKGLNFAKKYLSPEQLQKLKVNYLKCFSTYGITALGLSLAVGLGGIVASKIENGGRNQK